MLDYQKLMKQLFRLQDEETFDIYLLIDDIKDNWNWLSEIGIDFNTILGCGYMGCVFATKNPNVVAKFTVDHAEIDYYEVARQNDQVGILPKVYLIKTLNPQFEEWYFVLREAVVPLKNDREFEKNKPEIRREIKKVGLDLRDVRWQNVGRSVEDGRFVLFDGRIFGGQELEDIKADLDSLKFVY